MKYLPIFSPQNLALLSDWLQETGELYVYVHLPHSGSSGSSYFIHTMKELKILVDKQTWHEILFTIFRRKQFPLHGIADEKLLEQALQQIPDGEYYCIVNFYEFPSFLNFAGSGNSHAEFKREFADVLGEEVRIGQDPFDIYSQEWISAQIEDVFEVGVSIHNQYAVKKNQDYYESYTKEPERYQWLVELWNNDKTSP